ncbi:NAD(P)/FAD-dependent oxidoreductase [Rhodococcus sp. NPDC058514]|uniref:NAD(P)/FAD-dependent oxidoreductase n=1 Tax=unclassified Rhodococcus (in: high G+C Gram-positive bacteria) TaxID=192944 RepID=UPI003659BD67
MSSIVIVGTGIAGITAAETLRADGFSGAVTVIGEDAAHPYRRPALSKDLLLGTMPAEKARLRGAEYWSERGIEFRTSVAVTSIEVDARTVRLETGEELPYDALLLATGGRARQIEHSGGDAVRALRSMDDVAPLRAAIERTNSILVIGAGLIGSEVAATARGLGAEVTMLEAASGPLNRVLPPQVGALYEQIHREHGVALHTSVRLTELASDGAGGVRATAADGRTWSAGAALLAVGMVPNTLLAEQAGLAISEGIVVDEGFATSAPGVYAAGDVANCPNLVLGGRHRTEHWNSAQEQGASAARAMLAGLAGAAAEPVREVPWCWSSQYGLNLQVAGWPQADDEIVVRGSIAERDFTVLTRRAGRLVGAVTLGRPRDLRAARVLIGQSPTIDPVLLADEGEDLTALSLRV